MWNRDQGLQINPISQKISATQLYERPLVGNICRLQRAVGREEGGREGKRRVESFSKHMTRGKGEIWRRERRREEKEDGFLQPFNCPDDYGNDYTPKPKFEAIIVIKRSRPRSLSSLSSQQKPNKMSRVTVFKIDTATLIMHPPILVSSTRSSIHSNRCASTSDESKLVNIQIFTKENFPDWVAL